MAQPVCSAPPQTFDFQLKTDIEGTMRAIGGLLPPGRAGQSSERRLGGKGAPFSRIGRVPGFAARPVLAASSFKNFKWNAALEA